jgi:hypothetical protein
MATNDDLLRELQKISAALQAQGTSGAADREQQASQAFQVATEEAERLKQALDEGTGDLQKYNDKLAEAAQAHVELLKAQGASAEAIADAKEELDRATKSRDEFTKSVERSKKVTEDFDNALKRNIKTFTGITDSSDTLAGSFFTLAKEQGGVSAAFKQMRDVIGETVTATSMATSVFAKFAEGSLTMAFALDSATAGFAKATGLGNTFNDQIIELERNNRQFGVSADASKEAMVSLVDGLSGFVLMDKDVQSALATEVAQLSELGVAAGDSTGAFQGLTKTFGFTEKESMSLVKETEKLSGELGISLADAINDVNANMDKLAHLSKNEVGPALAALQKQSVETGLSMGELVDIGSRFQTFEDAATAAGNLNAVLQGQFFDTTALLEASIEDPAAAIDMLRDGIQASGKSLEDMAPAQRIAIANAMGLSTAELGNLMNAQEITEEKRREEDARKDNLKAAMDMKKELMALAAELTVALQPVFNVFKSIVGFIAQISRSIRSLLGGGGLGSVASAAVMIGGGALIGSIVSKTMRALGFKGPKGNKGDPIYTRITNPGFGDGGGGGDDDGPLGRRGQKLKNMGLDALGRGAAQSRATTAARGGALGRLRQAYTGSRAGGASRLGSIRNVGRSAFRMGKNTEVMEGARRFAGKAPGAIRGAAGFARGVGGELLTKARGVNVGGLARGAGSFLKGGLSKLGGGKLLAKLGSRAIPGLGQAMLAFDGVKFLGPKLLKGVKALGPKLLGGVKKFGGAALGLLSKAGSGLKSFGGRAVKGVMGALGKVPVLGSIGRGLGSAAKSVGSKIGGALKKLKFWNEGTDATPSLSSNQIQIAGDGGPNAEPEMIVPPPKSAVINNANLTNALEGMAGGGAGDPQMASAISNLGTKLDTLITEVRNLNNRPIETTAVIGKKDFAREVNGHFGRSGVSPATSAV